ncbi:glutathione S-transferase [Novosphingobium chloroacetimidivorans]|uniref:Glutathione S-transferase n=1 Tax=Novosphingobium chloroacetimidivorans TaxID=1428314 RepID=A0A7W7KAQ9_9SPHN|nr:glutathione S-transferase family protein [Novosphingobium chloroacetimidivorans]MBB4859036.1 glutathione S-transferase [Novosphingobium chloroacetimidivorans]
MPIDPQATIEITAFDWVPPFAQGYVRDLRPRWACEEMDLAYRERLISAVDRPEWYFRDQPWGQVPTLRDGDLTVFESGATLVHLGEKGGLLPLAGQARAAALSWIFAAYNSIEPYVFEWANVAIFSKKQEWAALRKPSLMADLGGRLDRLQDALGDREWLGEAFSVADIAMVTVLRGADDSGLLEERPALAAYVQRGVSRPAFQTALAAQLAAFSDEMPSRKSQEA